MDITDRKSKWFEAAVRCNDRDNEERINKAAIELEEFLQSNAGQIAIHQLLRVANKHIVFGTIDQIHPCQDLTIVALTGGIKGGIRVCRDEYLRDAFPARYVEEGPADAATAINAAVRLSHMEPEKVLPWLLDELDKIAASIP